jgi:hypothetical protein
MPDMQPSPPATRQPRGLATRLVGVLTSPRATYADIAAHPHWLGGMIAIMLVTILPVTWLLQTEVGRSAGIDLQLQTLESFGQTVTDDQYEQMERMAAYGGYLAAASQIVLFLVVTLVVAGVVFAVFNGGLGANATFRQVFAIVTFSSAVTGLRTLFSTPLNYARESMSSPTSLSAALPFFEDNTFGARLLGSIDLFLIWWVVSLAIGLGVLYKRRTAPIATTMLIAYGAIALIIAAVRSTLAGD